MTERAHSYRLTDLTGVSVVREPEIAFDAAPPVGTVLMIDGLAYELVGAETYIRKTDGQPSALLKWRGTCADCGRPFDIKTGLRAGTVSKRCSLHKAPGKPATPAAKARWAARGAHRRTSATGGRS